MNDTHSSTSVPAVSVAPGLGPQPPSVRVVRARYGVVIDADTFICPPNDGGCVVVAIGTDGRVAEVLPWPDAQTLPPHLVCDSGETGALVLDVEVVCPGFVDIHNHGLGGSDNVLTYWLNHRYTTEMLVRTGTTSCLATMIFSDDQSDFGVALSVCDHLKQVIHHQGQQHENQQQQQQAESKDEHGSSTIASRPAHSSDANGGRSTIPTELYANQSGAIIEGIHAEGPIVATLGGLPESRRMAAEWSVRDFTEFVDRLVPDLRVMTISPSAESIVEYSRMRVLFDRRIRIAIGHDKEAHESDILGALQRFSTIERPLHVTHLFNVMNVHHRSSGIANFGLLSRFPNIPPYAGLVPPTVEIIGDLVHVSSLALQLALLAKDHESVSFITDAISERAPGKTVLYGHGRHVQVGGAGDAVYGVEDSAVLHGSCSDLLFTFQTLVNRFHTPVPDAVRMCSSNPARVIDQFPCIGTLRPGGVAWANLVCLRRATWTVEATVVRGRLVFQPHPDDAERHHEEGHSERLIRTISRHHCILRQSSVS